MVMTYKGVGVDYDSMDSFKRVCQKRASKTIEKVQRLGVKPIEASRGESVYLVKIGDQYFGHVEEGLGTKNLVADAVRKLTGKTYYDQIAQCTIAMIVNDMATLGILPVSLAMHLAVGHSDWFKDEERVNDLVEGWGRGCDLARCIWAGGETPTLKGIVMPEASLLSGSAFGMPRGINILDASNIQKGDAIVFLESSGIHANGLTLARSIADKLPEGYATLLSDGRMYGEALLDPTHIYCDFVEDCLISAVDIHYCVNITGHGWRKLMRAPQQLAYVIENLPSPLPVFDFIQEHGPVSDEEAFGNLNMGAGFAIFLPHDEVPNLLRVSKMYADAGRFKTILAGYIEESPVKKVVIRPKGLEYASQTLAVR